MITNAVIAIADLGETRVYPCKPATSWLGAELLLVGGPALGSKPSGRAGDGKTEWQKREPARSDCLLLMSFWVGGESPYTRVYENHVTVRHAFCRC